MDVLAPLSLGLQSKIGSIVAHAEEAMGSNGHEFDVIAIRSLLADPEVVSWMRALRSAALLPVSRAAPTPRTKP